MARSKLVRLTCRATVVGLGGVLGLLTVCYFAVGTRGRPLDVLKVVIPLFLSLGVTTLGVGLARADASDARIASVAASGVAGAVLLGVASSFTLAVQQLEGGGAVAYEYLFLTNGSIGAAVGTLLGVYRVRLQRRTDQLATEVSRLNEFAGIVAHDLRNPLHIAQGYLGELDPRGREETVATIEQSHARMERLIEHVLALSRRGDAVGETTAVAVASVARSAWADVPTGDATLRVATDQTIEADERRLHSLFENLFRNAVEHGSTNSRSQAHENAVEHGSTSSRPSADDAVEHGSASRESGSSTSRGSENDGDRERDGEAITVTVGEFEGGFYVADDGRGIPTERREQVFEGGYSSDEAGTGLGLAIVRQIADAHGWSVGVTESEDGGARFEFAP